MILNLNNNLFSKNPKEFYKKYGIEEEQWKNIIYHYKFLEYKQQELIEFINVIYKTKVELHNLQRMLIRDDLYKKAEFLKKKGEKTSHIKYFSPHEAFIKQYYDK
jgi:hypothetical protein